EIELRVSAKHFHYFMAVELERLADIPDLVRKAHLQRMEAVANILHHLGGLYRSNKNRCLDIRVKTTQPAGCLFIVCADQGERRRVEVFQRHAFTQELRIDTQTKIPTGFLSRALFEPRLDDALDTARQHRAAN